MNRLGEVRHIGIGQLSILLVLITRIEKARRKLFKLEAIMSNMDRNVAKLGSIFDEETPTVTSNHGSCGERRATSTGIGFSTIGIAYGV